MMFYHQYRPKSNRKLELMLGTTDTSVITMSAIRKGITELHPQVVMPLAEKFLPSTKLWTKKK